MKARRMLRHLLVPHWNARRLFPEATLDAIEAAISRTEKTHGGEIRFAIETALPMPDIWNDIGPRHHARAVFAHLGVWNTEQNNGVLIFLLLADRDVEIIADRGLTNRVTAAEWEGVCRLMEGHYREGRYLEGSVAGVEAVGSLLARHFPAQGAHPRNELPDRPVLL
ncbi:MAG: TPM domain-containing protein [Proteobacteria bacterium]|nr:TPM domain-containing protein [Pseudomonadota bacterium]